MSMPYLNSNNITIVPSVIENVNNTATNVVLPANEQVSIDYVLPGLQQNNPVINYGNVYNYGNVHFNGCVDASNYVLNPYIQETINPQHEILQPSFSNYNYYNNTVNYTEFHPIYNANSSHYPGTRIEYGNEADYSDYIRSLDIHNKEIYSQYSHRGYDSFEDIISTASTQRIDSNFVTALDSNALYFETMSAFTKSKNIEKYFGLDDFSSIIHKKNISQNTCKNRYKEDSKGKKDLEKLLRYRRESKERRESKDRKDIKNRRECKDRRESRDKCQSKNRRESKYGAENKDERKSKDSRHSQDKRDNTDENKSDRLAFKRKLENGRTTNTNEIAKISSGKLRTAESSHKFAHSNPGLVERKLFSKIQKNSLSSDSLKRYLAYQRFLRNCYKSPSPQTLKLHRDKESRDKNKLQLNEKSSKYSENEENNKTKVLQSSKRSEKLIAKDKLKIKTQYIDHKNNKEESSKTDKYLNHKLKKSDTTVKVSSNVNPKLQKDDSRVKIKTSKEKKIHKNQENEELAEYLEKKKKRQELKERLLSYVERKKDKAKPETKDDDCSKPKKHLNTQSSDNSEISDDKIDLRSILTRKRKQNPTETKLNKRAKSQKDSVIITVEQGTNSKAELPKSKKTASKLKTKESKRIKLVINIVCPNSGDSDDSEEAAKNLSTSPHQDLSFLDDFNVDEIVDSLNVPSSRTPICENSHQDCQDSSGCKSEFDAAIPEFINTINESKEDTSGCKSQFDTTIPESINTNNENKEDMRGCKSEFDTAISESINTNNEDKEDTSGYKRQFNTTIPQSMNTNNEDKKDTSDCKSVFDTTIPESMNTNNEYKEDTSGSKSELNIAISESMNTNNEDKEDTSDCKSEFDTTISESMNTNYEDKEDTSGSKSKFNIAIPKSMNTNNEDNEDISRCNSEFDTTIFESMKSNNEDKEDTSGSKSEFYTAIPETINTNNEDKEDTSDCKSEFDTTIPETMNTNNEDKYSLLQDDTHITVQKELHETLIVDTEESEEQSVKVNDDKQYNHTQICEHDLVNDDQFMTISNQMMDLHANSVKNRMEPLKYCDDIYEVIDITEDSNSNIIVLEEDVIDLHTNDHRENIELLSNWTTKLKETSKAILITPYDINQTIEKGDINTSKENSLPELTDWNTQNIRHNQDIEVLRLTDSYTKNVISSLKSKDSIGPDVITKPDQASKVDSNTESSKLSEIHNTCQNIASEAQDSVSAAEPNSEDINHRIDKDTKSENISKIEQLDTMLGNKFMNNENVADVTSLKQTDKNTTFKPLNDNIQPNTSDQLSKSSTSLSPKSLVFKTSPKTKENNISNVVHKKDSDNNSITTNKNYKCKETMKADLATSNMASEVEEVLPISYTDSYIRGMEKRMLEYLHVNFTITDVIHKGFFSSIYKCEDPAGETYALKVVKSRYRIRSIAKDNMLSNLLKSTTKDSCILNIIKSFNMNGSWCFLTEYYPKTLKDALMESGKCFHIDLVQILAKQLISAVTMLTNKQIVHSDIRPSHILLNSANDKLKLCSFDRAEYNDCIRIKPSTGTASYRAPEIILGFEADYRIDVWATALVMYEMATGIQLFPGKFNNDILYKQLCTLGPLNYDMLEKSIFWQVHFEDSKFKRIMPNGSWKFVRFCGTNDRLRHKLFSSYNRFWRSSRTQWQITEDFDKIEMLFKLLEQMLILDPRLRLPITFAGANEFIFDSMADIL